MSVAIPIIHYIYIILKKKSKFYLHSLCWSLEGGAGRWKKQNNQTNAANKPIEIYYIYIYVHHAWHAHIFGAHPRRVLAEHSWIHWIRRHLSGFRRHSNANMAAASDSGGPLPSAIKEHGYGPLCANMFSNLWFQNHLMLASGFYDVLCACSKCVCCNLVAACIYMYDFEINGFEYKDKEHDMPQRLFVWFQNNMTSSNIIWLTPVLNYNNWMF